MIVIQHRLKSALKLKEMGLQIRYEFMLIVFLGFRFIFKNLPDVTDYFTEQPVFNLPSFVSILLGSLVLFLVIVLFSVFFEKTVRGVGAKSERSFLFFFAVFLANPVALPFLFNASGVGGSQLLFPFAVFVIALFLAANRVSQWLLPLLCSVFFIPLMFSSESFWIFLRKSAVLYVSLILLYLFIKAIRPFDNTDNKSRIGRYKTPDFYLFLLCATVSALSYFISLTSETDYSINVFRLTQEIDLRFAVALALASPVVITAVAVLRIAMKSGFSKAAIEACLLSAILLFPFFRTNYVGLWIPFLVLSLYMLILVCVSRGSASMISAVTTVGSFFEKHAFIYFVFLMVTASLSDISSAYLSPVANSIFGSLPF